jgi:hypothetical protein
MGAAVAELAKRGASPALNGPPGEERASVEPARRHGFGGSRKPDDRIGGRNDAAASAESDLAVGVAPPALHCAIEENRAGVPDARADGLDAGGEPQHVVGSNTGDRGCAAAELAKRVAAPAFDSACRSQHAGVELARLHGRDAGAEGRDVDGRVAVGSRHAQLKLVIPTPALHAPGRGERAVVAISARDRHHAAGQSHDVDGCRAIGIGAVAQLAFDVASPALDAPGGRERACMGARDHLARGAGAQRGHLHRREGEQDQEEVPGSRHSHQELGSPCSYDATT